MSSLPYRHSASPLTTMDPHSNAGDDPPPGGTGHEWAATTTDELTTQIMPRDTPGAPARAGLHEIGKLITADTRELFVSCDAAEALRQQISHLGCVYIALHDLGTATSRQLLRQLAAHGGSAVRKLSIRQQGFGTTLATVEYAVFEAPGLPPVQIYSTAADTTPHGQQAVARTLMELSATTVVLLGEAPGQGAANALRGLMQFVHGPQWICPNLLIVPLGSGAATAAAAQSSQVVQRHGMLVRATPQPARPSDAWSYILGFWQKNTGRGRLAAPDRVTAAPMVPGMAPLSLDLPPEPVKAPPAAAPTARPAPSQPDAYVGLVPTYVGLLTQMTGLQACCVFDAATGTLLGHAGQGPSGADMARQGHAILSALQMARLAMNLSDPAQETLISSDRHHQVVRPLPGHPELALHCLLDRHKTNQSLVRFQLQRLDGWLKQQPRGSHAHPPVR